MPYYDATMLFSSLNFTKDKKSTNVPFLPLVKVKDENQNSGVNKEKETDFVVYSTSLSFMK